MKFKSSGSPVFETNNKSNSKETHQEYSQPEIVHDRKPKDKNRSVIGSNIKFRGEMIGTENIHIEGSIEGTIIMKGHNLSIGTQGSIDANVYANNITIHGKLNGDVLADELISIKSLAEVKGNLIAPRIQLDDGGKFRGSMDMVDSEQEKKDALSNFQEKLIHPHLPDNSKRNNSKQTDYSKKAVALPSADDIPKSKKDSKDKMMS